MNTYNETKMYENYASEVERMQKCIDELQQENQQLKLINSEYERLNKENGRGFKITSVKEYNIDELLKCKNNWEELKNIIKQDIKQLEQLTEECPRELKNTMVGTRSYETIIEYNKYILSKMQELERV